MKKSTLIIIVLTAIIAGSCKKYEEGPCISFRSVYARLEGKWKVKEIISNGIDSTQYYNANCGCKMSIPSHTEENSVYFECYPMYSLSYFGCVGHYSFSKIKKYMNVTYWGQGLHFGPIGQIDCKWEILRLTKDDFKISTVVDGNNYVVLFYKLQ